MKLNKPHVTESQSELESYVASMLNEQPASNVNSVSKVTPLRKVAVSSVKTKVEVVADSENKNNNGHSARPKSLEAPKNNEAVSQEIQTQLENKLPEHLDEEDLAANLPDYQPQADVRTVNNKTSQPNSKEVSSRFITKSIDNEIEVTQKPPAKSLQPELQEPKNIETKEKCQESALEVSHQVKVAKELKAYTESEYNDEEVEDPRLKNVEKLLSRIALASAPAPVEEPKSKTKKLTKTTLKQSSEALVDESQGVSTEAAEASFFHRENSPLKDILGRVFQTLVLEVNNLPLAVPLVKLGGIVNLNQEQITPLVGTPDWFLGLVPNDRGNLMVVDTQKFLMPENKLEVSNDYQYLIVLDDSRWALACHSVGDAKNLTPDDVRWSARTSKRPWFAGMVVEYMSALIEVDQLINMLANEIVD